MTKMKISKELPPYPTRRGKIRKNRFSGKWFFCVTEELPADQPGETIDIVRGYVSTFWTARNIVGMFLDGDRDSGWRLG